MFLLLFFFFLQTQLRRERTEERRKMFELVNRNKRGECGDDDDYTCMDTTLAKWRQIMPDNKLPTDGPNSRFGFSEKKHTGKITNIIHNKL